MTAEQQLKKLNKIHLGTVTHGFCTRTVLKVAKGSVTAWDFLSRRPASGNLVRAPAYSTHHHSVDVKTSRALVRAPVVTSLVRYHLSNAHHATGLGAWSVLQRTSDRGMFHNRSMSAPEEWSRW